MKLDGNTVFITGGGSGIGRGLAEAFHKRGNRVIIGGRRLAVLDQTVAANPGMEAIVIDTANRESIRAASSELIRRFPSLNVVINNAGVQRSVDFGGDAEVDEAAMAEEIDTNINGVLRVTAAFLPHMKTQGAAVIVNVSSGLAFVPMARFPVYCATKAFVHSFSLSLRHQLKNTGVRIVEVAPPWVATDLGAGHTPAQPHGGLSPMPLAAFIAAAMEELASDADELPVAGAKFLYNAGVGSQAAAVFGQINR